jgi:hypothetical protein
LPPISAEKRSGAARQAEAVNSPKKSVPRGRNEKLNMLPEEQGFDTQCLVCGKGVEHGEGFCRLKVEQYYIALCCPLCMEVYEKNPQRYLAKLTIRVLRPPGVAEGGCES